MEEIVTVEETPEEFFESISCVEPPEAENESGGIQLHEWHHK